MPGIPAVYPSNKIKKFLLSNLAALLKAAQVYAEPRCLKKIPTTKQLAFWVFYKNKVFIKKYGFHKITFL
jgi:hypothetical protein